jgi:hypothetical protein
MRIFVLGDSYADNLFAEGYDDISKYDVNSPYSLSEIAKYLISLQNSNIENAKWWTDWLEEWGYEIVNLGLGGCSNQNIFYQFAKIDKEFKEGDRIILHWTDHCRFDWIVDELGHNMSIHPNINASHFEFIDGTQKSFLQNQIFCRDNSFKIKDGYLNTELIPFMNWIVEKHSEYNPIVWCVFSTTMQYLNKSRYFDFENIPPDKSPHLSEVLKDKWNIRKESGDLFNDGHYGRYGNYYMAVLFDEMIKSEITTNFNNKRNSSLIYYNSINRIKNENLIFRNPSDWSEHFKKDIKERVVPANNFSKWISEKHKLWF